MRLSGKRAEFARHAVAEVKVLSGVKRGG
jgi:hypothetical protein